MHFLPIRKKFGTADLHIALLISVPAVLLHFSYACKQNYIYACNVKLWDILKVKNACVKAVNYVKRYAFTIVVTIAFYYARKAECAATASGFIVPAHNDCSPSANSG